MKLTFSTVAIEKVSSKYIPVRLTQADSHRVVLGKGREILEIAAGAPVRFLLKLIERF